MVEQLTHNFEKPLRILMVTPRYLPEMGGVENHVYQVASRLARSGIEVTVLTTDRSGSLPSEELANSVRIKRVRAWPTWSDFYFAPGIYRFMQQSRWDLVHIQSYHTLVAPFAMLAARQAKIPYLLTFHGGGHSVKLRNIMRGSQLALLRPLLIHAERLVALAHFEEAYYSRRLHLSRDHFALIPNGSDLPKPASLPRSQNNGTMIASVGRLERYKGHQRIIAALPAILQQKPDVWLWIAGKGPYESTLRNLAMKLGVADRVRIQAIPGEDRESMARELGCASLVVLLSDYETHPIAVLEALALGRPALVSDTSGLGELCVQGLARGIPLDSTPEQVAAAVLEQLRDPLIPEKIVLPSWDDCANGLLHLYREILARRN